VSPPAAPGSVQAAVAAQFQGDPHSIVDHLADAVNGTRSRWQFVRGD